MLGFISVIFHIVLFLETYVDYMAKVASAAPNLPFLLYDIDFMTGVKCK